MSVYSESLHVLTETTPGYHRCLRDLKLIFHLQLYKMIVGKRRVTTFFSLFILSPRGNYSMSGRNQLKRKISEGQATFGGSFPKNVKDLLAFLQEYNFF